jgi:hypothetical protein
MIIRTSRKNRFTVIPNDLLEDPSLDWKDLGLLVYLLSKPDNWEISVEHLKKQRKMGRDAIYKCLDAIIDAGYARREKQRDGTIDWFIFDDKLTGESMTNPDIKPNPEKPEEALQSQILKSRITENPYYGKTDTNKDLINKQELIKEIKTDKSLCGEAEQPEEKHDPVIEIFDYWKATMHHPRAKMDDKRKKAIKNALKIGYEAEDLKSAIVGCSLTPHNMGMNDRNEKYDGIDLILRDAAQIDRFIANSINPPKQKSPASGVNRIPGSKQPAQRPDYSNLGNLDDAGSFIDSVATRVYQ